MARSQQLRHRSPISSGITNWRSLGENTGYPRSLVDVHLAFMASSGHRANILSMRYREVGVSACRDARGRYWSTRIFRG